MILHVFVDSLEVTAPLPEDVITLSLQFTVNYDKVLDMTAPMSKDEQVLISKTLHFPLLDDVSQTSDMTVNAAMFRVDGRSVSLGDGSTTATSLEHGVAKQINLNDGKKGTGKLKCSVYYYRFPMDINDFQENPGAATEQQRKYMKEYAFLQRRRMRWGGHKESSWNNTSERLLEEDPTVAVNRDVMWRKERKPCQAKAHEKSVPNKSRKVLMKEKIKSEPKLRKTCLSVFHCSTAQSGTSGQNQEEKILLKLHLAEQKRLQLLHTAAAEARKRNLIVDDKIKSIKNCRSSVGKTEYERLKRMLLEKEQMLEALRNELRHQKHIHRKDSASIAPGILLKGNKEIKRKKRRSGSRENSRQRVCAKQKPKPSYLAPTSCWTAKNSIETVDNRRRASVSLRDISKRRKLQRRKSQKLPERDQEKSLYIVANSPILNSMLNSSSPLSTSSSSSSSLVLSDTNNIYSRKQTSHQEYVNEVLAGKSLSALSLIQEIKDVQNNMNTLSFNDKSEETINEDSSLNRIIKKYSACSSDSKNVVDNSTESVGSSCQDSLHEGSKEAETTERDSSQQPDMKINDSSLHDDINDIEMAIYRLEVRPSVWT